MFRLKKLSRFFELFPTPTFSPTFPFLRNGNIGRKALISKGFWVGLTRSLQIQKCVEPLNSVQFYFGLDVQIVFRHLNISVSDKTFYGVNVYAVCLKL